MYSFVLSLIAYISTSNIGKHALNNKNETDFDSINDRSLGQ